MVNKKFEAYKIARELKRSGTQFTFFRKNKNDFGEPVEHSFSIGSVLGLYHEQNSYIQLNLVETTQYRTKKVPMILCLFKEISKLKIEKDDYVKINDKQFKVTGITNIQEWNIICDISLEVVDNGT